MYEINICEFIKWLEQIFKLIGIAGKNIALDIIFLIERRMLRQWYYPFDWYWTESTDCWKSPGSERCR